MRSFLLLALLALVFSQPAYPRVRPNNANGIDYINLATPALANIANQLFVPQTSTIWFTADKSNPNLWISKINSSATYPNDWWFEAGPTVFKSGTLPPFIAIDAIGDNIYGVALPSAINNADAYDTALSSVYYSGTKNQDGVAPKNIPGYSFYSIVMDQTKQPGDGHYIGYVLGWADDAALGRSGLFLGRFNTSTGPNAPILFNIQDDILTNISAPNQACYDLFSTIKKPSMWVDSKFLYVTVTGRCAFIIRVTLPGPDTNTTNFGDAVFQVDDPYPSVDQYLSSAVRDPQSNILYIAVQNYDRRVKTIITSYNLETMMQTSAPPVEIDSQGQAKALLAFGTDGAEKNLYVFASGSTVAYRYTADANGVLTLYGTANLPENFRTIGSVIANGPFVYFTTYRSDAVLARMTKTGSFCKTACLETLGFCDLGQCSCQAPWKKVYAPNGTLTCENPKIFDIVTKEVANEAAAVAFGVFFAFALVAALAGWYMWWRGKATNYQTL